MGKTTPNLLPRISRLLDEVGMHLKLARLRRKYSSETIAQRAGITRRTLSKVERGDPASTPSRFRALADFPGVIGVDE